MFVNYDAKSIPDAPGMAVYTDGLNKVFVTMQPGNKAAELAAAQTALAALYNGGTPIRTYALAFIVNHKTIFKAFYTFSEGFRLSTGTLQEYRAVLAAAHTIIQTLPAPFISEFTAERDGLALAAIANNATWTLAQCQSWHSFLGNWLGRAMAAVALAKIASDLD